MYYFILLYVVLLPCSPWTCALWVMYYSFAPNNSQRRFLQRKYSFWGSIDEAKREFSDPIDKTLDLLLAAGCGGSLNLATSTWNAWQYSVPPPMNDSYDQKWSTRRRMEIKPRPRQNFDSWNHTESHKLHDLKCIVIGSRTLYSLLGPAMHIQVPGWLVPWAIWRWNFFSTSPLFSILGLRLKYLTLNGTTKENWTTKKNGGNTGVLVTIFVKLINK